jgi:hypothetical protein
MVIESFIQKRFCFGKICLVESVFSERVFTPLNYQKIRYIRCVLEWMLKKMIYFWIV